MWQSSAIAERFLQENLADVAEIREYGKTQEHDLDLMSGRVDAIMASTAYISTAMKDPANKGMVLGWSSFSGRYFGQGQFLGHAQGVR